MVTAGQAVLFSGLTVFVGLLALIGFEFMAIRSLGIAGSLVVSVSVIAALTLLPAVLSIAGRNVDRLSVIRTGTGQNVAWARLALPATPDDASPTARSPSRATPISLCTRADLEWLLLAHRGLGVEPPEPEAGPLAEVLEALRRHGARFHRELAADTGRLAGDVERGLWDGVARGLLTSDGFHAVRSLLEARQARALEAAEPAWRRRRRTLRRGAAPGREPGEGRWALVPRPVPVDEPDDRLQRCRAIAPTDGLVVLSSGDDLPWVDGVAYFGRDDDAPSILWPTARRPVQPLQLVERALLRRGQGHGTPLLFDPDTSTLVGCARARPLRREWLEALWESSP